MIDVADSISSTVSTLFPADQRSFAEDFFPLANDLILQNEMPVINTLTRCLNLLFRSLLTSQLLCFLEPFVSMTAIGTPVSFVVHVMSSSFALTMASL